ncbi:MAG: autotransporter outer membrane beta-barrel domain-containing protein [Methylococcales symbiont of Hymedesmia sp. n. MRB-2018]|nr:MAG: autotransporter outer membrane beta-barrel domain-containing protein [Methylococcales symbiont of Hymedesmia sp. n. MRB-2018]
MISTLGDFSHGIIAWTATAITNSGSITTTGLGAHGIKVIKPGNITIENSGIISATGTDSYAIYGGSATGTNDITLNLRPGSDITGRINLGGALNDDGSERDHDIVNIYGGNLGASFTFENTETVNCLTSICVKSTNTNTNTNTTTTTTTTTNITTLGSDAVASAASSAEESGSVADSVHELIGQRVAPLKPTQLASTGILSQQRQPSAWLQAFGGTFERNKTKGASAYGSKHEGFTFGYQQDTNKTRLGLLGGYAYSNTGSGRKSFSAKSKHSFVGAYGHLSLGGINLTSSVLAGYGDHDNQRLVFNNINGYEVSDADINSFFISPSLTLSTAFPVITDAIEIRPSATVSYSTVWVSAYKEKGTTSNNQEIDSRTLQTVKGRLQLAGAYLMGQGNELELRTGINSRASHNEKVNSSLAGQRFSYNSKDNDNSSGFVGAKLRVTTNQLNIVGDIEYGKGNKETDLAGTISLNYNF